jgi:hypothetical protein
MDGYRIQNFVRKSKKDKGEKEEISRKAAKDATKSFS